MPIFCSLDEIDLKLLRLIDELGEVSIAQLSQKVFLTSDAIWRRLRTLEKKGFIYICNKFSSAYYYSISPDFDMSLIDNSDSYKFRIRNFLEQLSFLQLLVFVSVAFFGSTSSTRVVQATGFNGSSVRSALGKFLREGKIDREHREDKNNSYVYLLSKTISKQNIVDFVLDSQLDEKMFKTFSQNGFMFSISHQTLQEKTKMQDQDKVEQQNGATTQNELSYQELLDSENQTNISEVDQFIEKVEQLEKYRKKVKQLETEISSMGEKAHGFISPLWACKD